MMRVLLLHALKELVMVGFLCFAVSAQRQRSLFQLFRSEAKCSSRILKSLSAKSFVCMSKCNQDAECTMVNVMDKMERCELLRHDDALPVATDSANGWSCYKMPNTDFTWVGKSFEPGTICSVLGKSKFAPAKSCSEIATSCKGYVFKSGLFWIQSSRGVAQRFCELETEADGWMEVARLNTSQNGVFILEAAESDNIDDLATVTSGKFALSVAALRTLKAETNFSYVRFYCSKRSTARIIDLATNHGLVVSWLLGFTASSSRPLSCGSFFTLADDTSVVSKQCNDWGTDQRWGHGDLPSTKLLWIYPFWLYAQSHWYFDNDVYPQFRGSYFCDDYLESSDPRGVWRIFVK